MNAKLSAKLRTLGAKLSVAQPIIEALFFIGCIFVILFFFYERRISIPLILVSIALYFTIAEVAAFMGKLYAVRK